MSLLLHRRPLEGEAEGGGQPVTLRLRERQHHSKSDLTFDPTDQHFLAVTCIFILF